MAKFLSHAGAQHLIDKIKSAIAEIKSKLGKTGYNIPAAKINPDHPNSVSRILLLGDLTDKTGNANIFHSIGETASYNDAYVSIPTWGTGYPDLPNMVTNWGYESFIQIPAKWDSSSFGMVMSAIDDMYFITKEGDIAITNARAIIQLGELGSVNIQADNGNRVNIGNNATPKALSVTGSAITMTSNFVDVVNSEFRVYAKDDNSHPICKVGTNNGVGFYTTQHFTDETKNVTRYVIKADEFKFRLTASMEMSYTEENGYRFKHSSASSFRLNDDGLTAYTTLTAKPDNCPDIAEYSDEDKAILNRSVQRNILDLKAESGRALFIELWNKAAGEWGNYNAATGFFELNGLTDITWDEAVEIYTESMKFSFNSMAKVSDSVRTLMPIYMNTDAGVYPGTNMFDGCSSLEALVFPNDLMLYKCEYMFYGCSNLRRIEGEIRWDRWLNYGNDEIFAECSSLEEFRIDGLNTDLNLVYSPKLTAATVDYLVSNAYVPSDAEPITITVHPTVYAKINATNVTTLDMSASPNAALSLLETSKTHHILLPAGYYASLRRVGDYLFIKTDDHGIYIRIIAKIVSIDGGPNVEIKTLEGVMGASNAAKWDEEVGDWMDMKNQTYISNGKVIIATTE